MSTSSDFGKANLPEEEGFANFAEEKVGTLQSVYDREHPGHKHRKPRDLIRLSDIRGTQAPNRTIISSLPPGIYIADSKSTEIGIASSYDYTKQAVGSRSSIGGSANDYYNPRSAANTPNYYPERAAYINSSYYDDYYRGYYVPPIPNATPPRKSSSSNRVESTSSRKDKRSDSSARGESDSSTSTGNYASYPSSSTGRSTWSYGLYWIRRAFSRDTIDSRRS